MFLIFDIGANIGKYALANVKPDTRIIAVEAVAETYKNLCENLTGHSNITPLQTAISPSKELFIKFYSCSCDTLSTLDINWLISPESRFGDLPKNIQSVIVPNRTLDSLIQEFGVPDLLKIDVEGAEEIVIQSLTQKVPMLCFEWAAEWRESLKRAVDYLTSLGFKEFYLQVTDEYTFRPTDFPLTADTLKAALDKSVDKEDWGMCWCR